MQQFPSTHAASEGDMIEHSPGRECRVRRLYGEQRILNTPLQNSISDSYIHLLVLLLSSVPALVLSLLLQAEVEGSSARRDPPYPPLSDYDG